LIYRAVLDTISFSTDVIALEYVRLGNVHVET
jgi:hypothetical protein